MGEYSDDEFDDEEAVSPAPAPAPAPAPKPGGSESPKPLYPGSFEARPPPTRSPAMRSPRAPPKIDVKPVNRIIQTPPEPEERVDKSAKRIINAKGESLPLDSPRMKFAIKHAGVNLPEIFPQEVEKFVKDAQGQGLPEEVGKRRYYAYELTRQDAVKTILAKREQKIKDDAHAHWQRANSKVDIVKQMFDTIDDDGNGTLELEEFKLLVKSLGLEMRPDQMEKSFNEMDEDGGGTIDFEEFQTFYYALTEGEGEGGNAKRMGKEMLANLHANMYNQAIQEAKSKMGEQMLKEQARFQENVKRMEKEENAKNEALRKMEQLQKEFAAEKKAREDERLRVFDQAVKAGFSRKVAKEKAFQAKVKQARKDLVKEMQEAEAEAARRTRNFQEAQQKELDRLRERDERRQAKKRAKQEQAAENSKQRVLRLEELEEEEANRLAKVKEQNDKISQRNREKARARAKRLERLKKNTLAETTKAQDMFSLKLQKLDNRLADREEDRQKSLSARTAAFEEKQRAIKAMEEEHEENRLNLAWTAQSNALSAEARRLAELSLKAEESKLWLETRAKKVERANRRKEIRLAEEKAQILDKHQKLDALAKQQKEFDKKRKGLAQDAYVAKLRLKHEQERQLQLIKQGKKVNLAANAPLLNDKNIQMLAKAGHDAEEVDAMHKNNVKKKTARALASS